MTMTPYYNSNGITLYHGDCIDILRSMAPGSVDAVITDPPYGIDYQSAWRTEDQRHAKIANDKAPFIWWLADACHVLADGGCMLCFCRWDTSELFRLVITVAGFSIRSQVVWDREIHGMADPKTCFSPRHDLVWFATKGSYSFHGGRPASVVRARRVNGLDLQHPNEKPLDLMTQMVTSVADRADVVLDPMCGSGTTLLAAQQTGRTAIGIELDERYCEIAANRLRRALEDPTPVQTTVQPDRRRRAVAVDAECSR